MADRAARGDEWRGLIGLARSRARQLVNVIDQQLREAPGRTLAALGMLLVIWVALYQLLDFAFRRVSAIGLIGLVAGEHLFALFFFALAIMLAFSNGILSFNSLYGRDEAAHLLSMPVHTRHVVLVKWAEGIVLSSWSFLLLGIPLMLAVASHTEVDWTFYPLFLAHFFSFVIIPAGIGLIGAWVIGMFTPRRPLAAGILLGACALLPLVYWLRHVLGRDGDDDTWISAVLTDLAVIKNPWLLTAWTARGVGSALTGEWRDSLFYLGVVAGNAFFLTWVVVNLLAGTWAEAFSRVQNGRLRTVIRHGWLTEGLAWLLFFYLPRLHRRVMVKDLRGFTRDARQWSQMLIMFGLLAIYALNLKRMPMELQYDLTQGLIAFLNLTTVSLIVATFTTRFIYPLLSLESQQLWLLELLPIRRSSLILVKFLFALTLTSAAAVGVMAISVTVLGLPAVWARIHLTLCFAVCVGLSGLSIGLGARFPVLTHRNPARIASGLGGTINLIASVLFVSLMMLGVAVLSLNQFQAHYDLPGTLTPIGWLGLCGLLAFAAVVTTVSLLVGARHFERLEN